MRSHPKSNLPNTPNYYWSQALELFDAWEKSGKNNSYKLQECYMWLFLYVIASEGE